MLRAFSTPFIYSSKTFYFVPFYIQFTNLSTSCFQAKITEVHGYFADVVQMLLMSHQWLTDDFRQ